MYMNLQLRSIFSVKWLLWPLLALALTAAPQTGAKPSKSAAATARSEIVDINSASREELDALPGIGKVYAQKIIDGRPYSNKSQLVSKGIIPKATYAKISSRIVARQKK